MSEASGGNKSATQRYLSGSMDDAAWDAFVQSHAQAHLLQTSGWAALKSRFGWQATRVALFDEAGRAVAGASILLRSVAGIRIAYAPKGPLTDWFDEALTGALLEAMAVECRRMGAATLKIEPDLPDTAVNRRALARHGFAPSRQSVQPRSTVLLDIEGDEDAILKRMKSKWRYNVRLAERKGVTVRQADAADLAAFNQLMAATGARDKFGVHAPGYYAAAFDLLTPGHGAFLLAEVEGRAIGAIVVGLCEESAWYLWGASSNEERNRMPNHALQWAGIRWAKAHGARRYDFWGIPDDVGKAAAGMAVGDEASAPVEALPINLDLLPQHGLWGVYRFKQGFGGEVVRYVGAWDKALQPLGHRLYTLGLSLLEQRGDWTSRLGRVGGLSRAAHRARPVCKTVHDPAAWRAALAELPAPHVLQSWEWGEVKAATGWHAERLIVAGEDGRTLAACQFLWRQLSRYLPVRVAYAPKGPVVDWADRVAVDAVLAAVESHAHARGCVFVKIDPDVREDLAEGVVLREKLRRRGWRFSAEQIQFKNTAVTDLRPDAGELLAAMKSKWRYNIRLAERRGIGVRRGGVDDLAAFYRLYAETGERDGFLTRPFAYYRAAWETFLRAEDDAANPAGGALLLAEHSEETEPVAGLFVFRYGRRVWYFYGASGERRRRDMPNYLLQWEAMRWAQERGCTVYDWWGAPTEVDDPVDSMQGVWQFKQGFGAEFQPHIGAWDYVVNPPLYTLYAEAMPRALGLMRRLRGIPQPAKAAG